MFKSIFILFSISISVLLAQSDVDQRRGNQPSSSSQLHSTDLVEEFGQCGGADWEGPNRCTSDYSCVKRSKYYSQCLPSESASRPVPPTIPADGKCHGGNVVGKCATGTACFIQTENVHGECKTHCPQGWFCTYQTLPEWSPCGGEGYVGLTNCKEGLQCFVHSRWYHECRSECPPGWKC